MSCYDDVELHCPKCAKVYYAQSKGGDCTLTFYTLENAPVDVLSNVNRHAPFFCPSALYDAGKHLIDEGGCDSYFAVDENTKTTRLCKNIDRESFGYINAFYRVLNPWLD